jgi:hypothetical protein
MFQKVRMLLALLLCASLIATAQEDKGSAIVKGHLVNSNSTKRAAEIQVILPELNLLTVTDGQGDFSFSQVPYGTHALVLAAPNTIPDTVSITVNAPVVDLGTIDFQPKEAPNSITGLDIPTIALDEGSAGNSGTDDDGNSTQNVTGMFTASRDPFLNTATFVFGPNRFQARGYERNQQQIQINGILMNDLETDNGYWNQWGGLNDVFRSRDNTYGLAPSEFGYGSVNGLVYYDATAANQRKQTRVTYSLTNRTYRNKLAFTQSSGLQSNGWAYSASVSKRWANEGYIDGTFYDGYSFYGAVSKLVKGKHFLNFTAFGTPTVRGKQSGATQEVYDLAGSNFYNPNWGYQNGEKRNARVANVFQPQFILNYEAHPAKNTIWNTSLGYQFGKNKNSTIDWYNGQDYRPDYYKYLPSYYTISYLANPTAVNEMTDELKNNPDKMQINWDRLYEVNFMNKEKMPNSTDSGRRSVYVVADDVDDLKKWVFNTNIEHSVNEHIIVYGGLSYINQRTESYRQLTDLLGGDYYLNYNQFAERDYVGNSNYNQNDLNSPDAIVKVGDKYSYNYVNQFHKATGWAQGTFTYNKFDFFVTVNGGINSFSREGLFKNGLFPANSFGKSKAQSFAVFGAKGGATYKLDGRNFLFVNANYSEDAPFIENTYISIRTRDFTVADPKTVKTKSIEGGYLMRAPRLNIRAVGYVTDMTDATEFKRFYHDDYRTFVSYVLTGVNMRFIGTELAVDVKVSPSLNVTGVAALGQAFYTSRPLVSIYRDNDTAAVASTKTAYIQNYYLGVGPQSNYNLGINYRSPHYWSANVNFSYFDRNYVDINAERRTPDAVELLEPGSKQHQDVLRQEKLPSAFTVNLFLTKSILLSKVVKGLPKNTFLYLSLGVNNLLNNTKMITGGYEWLRFDNSYKDVSRFSNKYFYGYGTNYFLNVGLKF